MNEDRIVGAGRNMLGKAERTLGEAVGSEQLQGDGVVDQVAGAIQHGYGQLREVVNDALDDAPGAIVHAVDRGRELGRRGDRAVRDQLGEDGPIYLIGGAIALFALGAFALSRSGGSSPKPSTQPRTGKAKRSN